MPLVNIGDENQNKQSSQVQQNGQSVSTQPQPNTAQQSVQNISSQQTPSNKVNQQTTIQNQNNQQQGGEVVEVKGPDFNSNNPPANMQTQQMNNPARMVNTQQQNPQNQPVVNSGNVQQPNINVQQTLSVENANIGAFLDLCETRNASDLHFTVGYPPLLRVDGKLERVGSEPITQEKSEELFVSIIDKKQLKRYHEDKELDFSYQHTSGSRFRVNLYFERGNMAGAFRLIPARIRTITELGLPDVIESFTKLPHGLVLVTGPTGSGKSTTLAALLNEINLTYPKHIITIEDPIEYLYGKGQALVDQREIGKDSMSWKNALKYLLRQDPDVVLVGEMRDFETISSTITVAETGHLVFATLHTNSAAQTIDRIIDVFPEHQQDQVRAQLAVVLQAVVSQRLVPLIGGGRKAVHEILIGTAAVRNAIREGKTYQIDNIIQTSADAGMFLIEKPLAELVRNGEITSETALEYTNKPSELKNLIGSN